MARPSCSPPSALVQINWGELGPTTVQLGAADSWLNNFSPGEIKTSSVNQVFQPWAGSTGHEQTSALLSLPCPYSVITTPVHKTLLAKSSSSKGKPFLISEDGEKRDKDRKRDVHRRGGCPHSSCPVKSPHRKLIPAPSHFSLVWAQLFTPIRQEKTHSIARLFLLETSSSFTNASLCFTLSKTGLCSTNKGYRNSLLHCQNWRRLRFGVLVGDWVKSSHLIGPNVWKFLPNSANYFS